MPRVKKSLSEAVSKEIKSKFDLSSFKEKKGLKKGDKFSLGVVQKKLGDMWKKLPEAKRKKYEEQTEKEKEEYYDKITEYETSLETNA